VFFIKAGYNIRKEKVMFEELVCGYVNKELVYMRQGRIEVFSDIVDFQPTLLSKVFCNDWICSSSY
jgi:hypothetical protein